MITKKIIHVTILNTHESTACHETFHIQENGGFFCKRRDTAQLFGSPFCLPVFFPRTKSVIKQRYLNLPFKTSAKDRYPGTSIFVLSTSDGIVKATDSTPLPMHAASPITHKLTLRRMPRKKIPSQKKKRQKGVPGQHPSQNSEILAVSRPLCRGGYKEH